MINSLSRIVLAITAVMICYAQAQSQETNASPTKPKVKVYLAGAGPDPQFGTILDGLTDFLVDKKVAAHPMDGESTASSSGYS